MKTIGIIGGLSPESTVFYYNGLNRLVNDALGGHHNAKILLSSANFGEFVALKEKSDWATQSKLLCAEAVKLEKAGADFIILATNTMHKMAADIEASISIPFLHLADATAARILETSLRKIGLLGTKYTMTLDFYKDRLKHHGIEPVIPDGNRIDLVNDIIYHELCHGVVNDTSRELYKEQINLLKQQGAEAVILGCTEITMLIKAEDVSLSVFDTTQIHIEEAAKLALA
jgi:aspartate racemase